MAWLCLSLLFLLGPTPVRATPPDNAVVTDTLFGVGGGKVFVLRSTRDNLGLHASVRTETWLVAIDPQSGEETLWPVHAARQDSESQEGGGEIDVTTTDRIEDAVNPFEVLARHGALPVLERNFNQAQGRAQPREAGGRLIINQGPEWTFAFITDDARARYRRSVETLAARIVDVTRMAPMSTRAIFEGTVSHLDQCSFEPFGSPVRVGPEGSDYQALRVSCSPGDGIEGHSLIQLVPRVTLEY